MRSLRFLVFLSLALATTSARAQDTTSVRDTLAYTTTIVTVRAKPFANAGPGTGGRRGSCPPLHLLSGVVQHRDRSPFRVRAPGISQLPADPPHATTWTGIHQLSRRVGSVTDADTQR